MMNYVENFDILEKKVKQIPCITGQGAPSTVDGAVGMLYIDTDSGLVYKCTSVNTDGFVWKDITAQPDWNQNDSSAPDYIKNRTHYKEIGEIVLYQGTVGFGAPTSTDYLGAGKSNYQYYLSDIMFPDSINSQDTIPHSFDILVNDVKFNVPLCINSSIPTLDYRVEVLEGEYIALGYTYWGRNILVLYCTEGLVNSIFTILTSGERYNPIDERYIPSNIVRDRNLSELVPNCTPRPDWQDFDPDSNHYIQNRTHGPILGSNKVYDNPCISRSVPTELGYKISITVTNTYQSDISKGSFLYRNPTVDQTITQNFSVCEECSASIDSDKWVGLGWRFLFVLSPVEYYNGVYTNELSVYSTVPFESCRLEVYLTMVYDQPLDDKYIPSTIARTSDVSLTNEDAQELLSELEGYVEEEEVVDE